MIVVERTNSCCGVGEIQYLYDLRFKKDVANQLKIVAIDYFDDDNKYCCYFWADNLNNKGGRNLADYIKKHKLGYVYRSTTRKNPNSGNYINAFIWNVDSRAFRKWYRELSTRK